MNTTYEIAKLTAKYDAMIKVNVPAKQGRKAYSYMREGSILQKVFNVTKKANTASGGISKRLANFATSVAKKGSSKLPIELVEIPDMKEELGEGVFGLVFRTPTGTAFKLSKDEDDFSMEKEVDITHEASEIGIAPKVLGVFKTDGSTIRGFELEFLEDHKTLGLIFEESGDDKAFMDKSFDDAAKTVFKMHQEGIVHGDLHLQNIMQKGTDTKIIDFGLSEKFKDKEYPTSEDLGLWQNDIHCFYGSSFKHIFGRDIEDEDMTPIQQTYKKVINLAKLDPKRAYKHYKEEMKNYV